MFKFCDIWCTFIGPFMFTRWSFYKLVYCRRAMHHLILALLQVHPSLRKDPLRIIRKRIRMNSRRQLCRNDAMKANQLSIDACYIYISLFMQNSESLEVFWPKKWKSSAFFSLNGFMHHNVKSLLQNLAICSFLLISLKSCHCHSNKCLCWCSLAQNIHANAMIHFSWKWLLVLLHISWLLVFLSFPWSK